VVGGRWLVAGGWWPVVGGRWLVAGGWWPVVSLTKSFKKKLIEFINSLGPFGKTYHNRNYRILRNYRISEELSDSEESSELQSSDDSELDPITAGKRIRPPVVAAIFRALRPLLL
jgi:hypothetical protein